MPGGARRGGPGLSPGAVSRPPAFLRPCRCPHPLGSCVEFTGKPDVNISVMLKLGTIGPYLLFMF